MDIEITKITKDQADTFLNLYNLYLYDLSEYTCEDPKDDGKFDPTNTYLYLEREELHPFFVMHLGKPIGFILVCSPPFVPEGVNFTIQELFLLRKYRGNRIASLGVEKVFKQLKGKISIGQLVENKPAVRFWKKYYEEHNIDFFEEQETIEIDGLGLQKVISQTFEIPKNC